MKKWEPLAQAGLMEECVEFYMGQVSLALDRKRTNLRMFVEDYEEANREKPPRKRESINSRYEMYADKYTELIKLARTMWYGNWDDFQTLLKSRYHYEIPLDYRRVFRNAAEYEIDNCVADFDWIFPKSYLKRYRVEPINLRYELRLFPYKYGY